MEGQTMSDDAIELIIRRQVMIDTLLTILSDYKYSEKYSAEMAAAEILETVKKFI